jgi:hypothetical protein
MKCLILQLPHVPGPASLDEMKLATAISIPLLLLIDIGCPHHIKEGLFIPMQALPSVVLRGGPHPLRSVFAIATKLLSSIRGVYVEGFAVGLDLLVGEDALVSQ